MSDKPEKIWLNTYTSFRHGCYIDTKISKVEMANRVEYIRADLAKPSEWISVGTPPREGGYVLAVYKGKLPFICMFHSDLNVFAFNCEEVRPTHWQPLPSPPTRETP